MRHWFRRSSWSPWSNCRDTHARNCHWNLLPSDELQTLRSVLFTLLLIMLLVHESSSAAPTSIPSGSHTELQQSLSFPELMLPFPAGSGNIIHGYGPDPTGQGRHNAGGNQYSLDFCQRRGCTQSEIGDLVVAPTDLVYEYSESQNNVDATVKDYHFFRVASDGNMDLCMALAHFRLIVPGGLQEEQRVSQGTVLGNIVDYRPSVPHLHMGMWTVPANQICAGPYEQRTEVAFEQRPYLLDGQSYEPDEPHEGPVVSNNVLVGDINEDETVNILDYSILIGCYDELGSLPETCSASQQSAADLNGDGLVGQVDYSLFLVAFRTWAGR